jgi:hemerythrin
MKRATEPDPFPVWQKGMVCGIQTIDNEHQNLLRRLDELRRLAAGQVEYANLVRRLMGLVRKIESHLAGEREMLAKGGDDPGLQALRSEDQDFLAICRDIILMVAEEADSKLINEELIWFLRHQLTRHIYRYADYYGEQASDTSPPDLLVWSPIFSVGEKFLDAEHKVLIGHVNKLNRLLRGETRANQVLEELEAFVDHARIHFEHESGMLHALDSDERDSHLEEHDQMLQQAEQLVERIKGGQERLTRRQLLDFVRDWVVHHILLVDMKIKYQYRRSATRAP